MTMVTGACSRLAPWFFFLGMFHCTIVIIVVVWSSVFCFPLVGFRIVLHHKTLFPVVRQSGS